VERLHDRTLKEIEELYPDEWVLVEETAWDEAEMPARGRVIVHSPERGDLTQEIKQISQQRPGAKLFSFFAGTKIPDGVIPIL
jgi:hypothetical protein